MSHEPLLFEIECPRCHGRHDPLQHHLGILSRWTIDCLNVRVEWVDLTVVDLSIVGGALVGILARMEV